MVRQPRGCWGPDSAGQAGPGGAVPVPVPQQGHTRSQKCPPRALPRLSSAERVAASAACLQMQALQDPLNCVLVQKRL